MRGWSLTASLVLQGWTFPEEQVEKQPIKVKLLKVYQDLKSGWWSLTQQRMISHNTPAGASVLTAFLQA